MNDKPDVSQTTSSEVGRSHARNFATEAVNQLWDDHNEFVKNGLDTEGDFSIYEGDPEARDRSISALTETFVTLLVHRGLVRVG